MKGFPKIKNRLQKKQANLTKIGYSQLVNLGKKFKTNYLSKLNLESFREANIKVIASSRQRCTDSAAGFLEGIQFEQDSHENEEKDEIMNESSEFKNNHIIETENFDSNYIFGTVMVCSGLKENTSDKIPDLSKAANQAIEKFMKHLENKYSFFIEHYISNPSAIPYMRIFTIYEYLSHVKAEKNLVLLSVEDELRLKVLITYLLLKWYTKDNDE